METGCTPHIFIVPRILSPVPSWSRQSLKGEAYSIYTTNTSLSIYMYVCIYIYIYIISLSLYIHICYIYIYIHTYIGNMQSYEQINQHLERSLPGTPGWLFPMAVLQLGPALTRHRLNEYFAQRVPSLSLASSFRNCSNCEVLKGMFPRRTRYPLS